jgi:hypothetical protein
MSKYQVHALSAHPHIAFEVEHESLRSAQKTVNEMKGWMCDQFGEFVDEYTFTDRDTILITDPAGKVVDAWQRDEKLSLVHFSKVSRENMPETFDGWQIVNADGYNIHGEHDDPFGLSSFSILCYDAEDIARSWVENNPGYSVVPVFGGDIEEPEFIVGENLSTETLRM